VKGKTTKGLSPGLTRKYFHTYDHPSQVDPDACACYLDPAELDPPVADPALAAEEGDASPTGTATPLVLGAPPPPRRVTASAGIP
jgi:hypothetical protein